VGGIQDDPVLLLCEGDRVEETIRREGVRVGEEDEMRGCIVCVVQC
jgi:hypothetical protein